MSTLQKLSRKGVCVWGGGGQGRGGEGWKVGFIYSVRIRL